MAQPYSIESKADYVTLYYPGKPCTATIWKRQDNAISVQNTKWLANYVTLRHDDTLSLDNPEQFPAYVLTLAKHAFTMIRLNIVP